MSPPAPVTVAIPSYNGERYIGEAIRSILAQEGVDFDLLLCDERSEDRTVEVARAEAGDRLRVEVNEARLGLAGNWNRCVALSHTPLVAIVHQDDLLRPGHLAAHVDEMVSNLSLGMSFSGATAIGPNGVPLGDEAIERGWLSDADSVDPPGRFIEKLIAVNPVRCSAVVLRKAAMEAIGGFDPSWKYVVDWECWLRLSRSWGVNWVARETVRFRWHEESETHRFRRGLLDLSEQARLLQDVLAREDWESPYAQEVVSMALERLGRGYLNRAYDALREGRPALARRAWRLARDYDPSLASSIWMDEKKLALSLLAAERFPWLVRRLGGRVRRPPLSRGVPAGDNDVLNNG